MQTNLTALTKTAIAAAEKVSSANSGFKSKPIQKVLVIFNEEERNYLNALKKVLSPALSGGAFQITLASERFRDRTEFKLKTSNFHYVIISCSRTANIYLGNPKEGNPTHHQASGSLFESRILIVPPLEFLFVVPYGNHVFSRWLEKIFNARKFIRFPSFTWSRAVNLTNPKEFEDECEYLDKCSLIAVDIETTKTNRGITCIAFSGWNADGNQIRTWVHDIRDPEFISNIRRILSNEVPKTFQRGIYDNSYLLRFASPTNKWIHDTAYFFHSWYSELPKDLGFLSGYFLRDTSYWKKEGKYATSLEEYHRYNAKDAYATLCIAIAQLSEAPAWAKKNFYINFPRILPALFCTMHGVATDATILAELLQAEKETLRLAEDRLCKMTNIKDFNARSPKQVKALLGLFGIDDGTDEKTLNKYADKHPLLERIIGAILDIRGSSKAIGTYFEPELFESRLLFELDIGGTETSRLASKESPFWCGTNIQNQPPYAKKYLRADPGFILYEIDNEQSETRCTAYLSEDANLINSVENGGDFHTNNITMFFGIPPEEAARLVKEDKAKGKDNDFRQLAKKINHGSSYNMGPDVFVASAGPKIIHMAKRNLKLPQDWKPRQVAEHLLNIFNKAYPDVKNKWYKEVIKEIAWTSRLTLPTGWTRYFFTPPTAHKRALNAAVAHGPQALSVQIINDGFVKIYKEIQLNYPEDFRLIAQVHDSIVFQVREGFMEERLVAKAKACMDSNIVEIRGRTLRIPTSVKRLGTHWGRNK